jgi:hypothetical protein
MSAPALVRRSRRRVVPAFGNAIGAVLGVVLVVAAAAAVPGVAGCGAEPERCGSPAELAAAEPGAARATADDVAAILERSCALGGCHLSGPGAGGLVLGRSGAAWRAALVNIPSQQNPAMALVVPGDPDGSWLVAKLDGALCGVTCDPALGCGGPMPPGAPLSPAERAAIAAWIADGAP